MKTRMRRLTAWFVIAALLVALAVVPAVASDESEPADLTIGWLNTPPQIDGVIDLAEWGASDILLTDYHMSTRANGYQKVPLDGQVWLGYDATHFYMAVAAEYETHQNDYSGLDIWRGDALQIQISADGITDRRSFGFALGDDGVSYGYQTGNYTLVYAETTPDGDFFISRDGQTNTTVYEIALPLSEFSTTANPLQAGGRIAMSFALHMHNGYYYEWYAGIVETKWLGYAAQIDLGGSKLTNAPLLYGDVDGNGTVDSTDARLTLQHYVGMDVEIDLLAADVDGNGAVDSTDARLILQRFVGIEAPFPAEEADFEETSYGVTYNRTISGNSFSPNSPEAGAPFESLDDIDIHFVGNPEAEDTNCLCYFALTTEQNAGLPFNLRCNINDEYISGMLPAGADRSALIPTFVYYGGEILANGEPLVSGVTALDLTEDVTITMTSRGRDSEEMILRVETLDTGLPSVALTTEGYTEITSRENYYTSTFYLGGGDAGEGTIMTAQSRGRGNSSWAHPKKSYRVKLDKKAALLGMSKSKHWTLISNYEDKTLLRNTIGEYLAEGTDLAYVAQNRPVDLWYNGEYWGTYTLTEKIEVESDRVNIAEYEEGVAPEDCGYLLEFDGHVNEVSSAQKAQWQYPLGEGVSVVYDPVSGDVFMPLDSRFIVIQEPSSEDLLNNPELLQYIYARTTEAISILRTRNYTLMTEVVDVPSFLWWGVVEEYMNNTDANYHSSCYMSLDAGGKFTMGPVWDFDRSSDNCDYWSSSDSWGTCLGASWLGYITSTPEGATRMRAAYALLHPTLDTLEQYLYDAADEIYASQQYNFEKWQMLDQRVNATKPDDYNIVSRGQANSQTFESEICRLVNYFKKRTAVLDAAMDYGE